MRGVHIIQGPRGPITAPEDSFIEAPWGIPGFRDEKSWVLVQPYHGYPIMMFQSTVTPHACLPVVIPWVFYNDFEMKVLDSVLIELDVYHRSEIEVLTVVTGSTDPTVNLFAPIVINKTNMLAMQAINQIEGYSARDPLIQPGSPEPIKQSGWDFPMAVSRQ